MSEKPSFQKPACCSQKGHGDRPSRERPQKCGHRCPTTADRRNYPRLSNGCVDGQEGGGVRYAWKGLAQLGRLDGLRAVPASVRTVFQWLPGGRPPQHKVCAEGPGNSCLMHSLLVPSFPKRIFRPIGFRFFCTSKNNKPAIWNIRLLLTGQLGSVYDTLNSKNVELQWLLHKSQTSLCHTLMIPH